MVKYTQSDLDRFWNKVHKSEDINECWLWFGSRNTKGYGWFGWRYRTYRAHRVSYEIHFGDIPDGSLVLHSCDNPSCVNPNHLRLGTAKENTKEMMQKGRGKHIAHKNEKNGNHKLTNEQVEEIRKRYADGNTSYKKLAIEYGVSAATIGDIVTFKTRKDAARALNTAVNQEGVEF